MLWVNSVCVIWRFVNILKFDLFKKIKSNHFYLKTFLVSYFWLYDVVNLFFVLFIQLFIIYLFFGGMCVANVIHLYYICGCIYVYVYPNVGPLSL